MVKEFLAQYGMEIISTIVVAIMGFIGICIKNVIKKISDDKTKEQVCKTVVKAVEQMYSDLTGDERYEKAVESVSEMLEEKGIGATELEVKIGESTDESFAHEICCSYSREKIHQSCRRGFICGAIGAKPFCKRIRVIFRRDTI